MVSRQRDVKVSAKQAMVGCATAMIEQGYALFDTAVGRCGIAWGRRGVTCVRLPEGSEDETRAWLAERFPDAREGKPSSAAQHAIDGIGALLRGEATDLSTVTLDMEGVPPFHQRVYLEARRIGPGVTLSYGEVAKRIGAPGSARAVGQALGRNPFAVVVPCHRVVASAGKPGGFSARGGVTTKVRMLTIDGANATQSSLFSGDGGFSFDPAAALTHLRTADPALARLIDAVGPFRMQLASTQSLFLALAQAIVYQQLSGKAAATIFGRVSALFPGAKGGFDHDHILGASETALRGAGLSRSKMLSLQDLARRSRLGEIPTLAQVHSMESEEVIEHLTAVRGIGRWTVEMLLMFRLGRPDVLPVDDYGIRKGFALTFKKKGLPTREDLEKRGVRWRPYRTVACWYLWRAVERSRAAKVDAGS
jgi:methylated-DNA-[protein]-cysteine S-methyltransferase